MTDEPERTPTEAPPAAMPPAELPESDKPPEHLDPAAVAKWREVYPTLESRGDTDPGSLHALERYCVAASQTAEADAKVRELGLVIKSAAGFAVENPYLAVARKAQATMRQWGSELKLTPRSRKATEAAGPDPEALKVAIVMHVAKVAAANRKAIQKDLRDCKANRSYDGRLRQELSDLERFGPPWQSALILESGGNSTSVCRALAALESAGLVTCYKPNGRTQNVRLTKSGEKFFKESQE